MYHASLHLNRFNQRSGSILACQGYDHSAGDGAEKDGVGTSDAVPTNPTPVRHFRPHQLVCASAADSSAVTSPTAGRLGEAPARVTVIAPAAVATRTAAAISSPAASLAPR